MWILFAFGSAVFAGLTSILAKCGIKKTDSNVATALRTIVVLVFSWIMVFIVGSQNTITDISAKTAIFLVLSGIATGASWLCYFKALQMGSINKVVPVDKSSIIFTLIFAFLFLDNESPTSLKIIAIVLIGIGTYMMIEKKKSEAGKKEKKGWFLYAFASALFASMTAILGKIGIDGVESNLGTALRTGVVLIMAWIVVLATGSAGKVRKIDRKELLFIALSGLATGASWLCYYKALHDGLASVVVPIDKLSILVTVLFSYLVFKEKLNLKSAAGLVLIVGGTLLMII